jgi:amyloid beta A4 protein
MCLQSDHMMSLLQAEEGAGRDDMDEPEDDDYEEDEEDTDDNNADETGDELLPANSGSSTPTPSSHPTSAAPAAPNTPAAAAPSVSGQQQVPTPDPYFTHFDPRGEHQAFKEAQQRLEEMHREKVTKVSK